MSSKIIYRILLGLACLTMGVLCVKSIVTPVQFEEVCKNRQTAITTRLIDLRTAEQEYKLVNGYYQADLDSVILFLQSTPKKELLKEGSLTEEQLEAGLNELKATKILEKALAKAQLALNTEDRDSLYKYVWANDKEVIANHLQGFRRDTIYKNMIETLFEGRYTAENIDQIMYIPYTDNQYFETEVNNNYINNLGIRIPLIEVRAPYEKYLSDQDEQELVNLIDKEKKLERYPGLKFGSLEAPNQNAGNWE